MVLHCAGPTRGFLPFSSVHPGGAEIPRFPKGRALREQKDCPICAVLLPRLLDQLRH
jgi:hypothetical protein